MDIGKNNSLVHIYLQPVWSTLNWPEFSRIFQDKKLYPVKTYSTRFNTDLGDDFNLRYWKKLYSISLENDVMATVGNKLKSQLRLFFNRTESTLNVLDRY